MFTIGSVIDGRVQLPLVAQRVCLDRPVFAMDGQGGQLVKPDVGDPPGSSVIEALVDGGKEAASCQED